MRQPCRIGMAVVLTLAALTGCHRYSYVQNQVTVIDAETGENLPGVQVMIAYGAWPTGPWFPPPSVSGVTGTHGTVMLPVTAGPGRDVWPSWRTQVDGYFSRYDGGDFRVAIDEVSRLVAAGDTGVVDLTLRCWAQPGPTALITLPTGYRGYARVCAPAEGTRLPNLGHQREFECIADAAGWCELPGFAILFDAHHPVVYRFRFADGTALPTAERAPLDGDTLAAWPLWFVDRCPVFVIAAESVAAAERRALWPNGVVDNSTYPAFEAKVRRGPF